jgi:hypothetical protein
MGRELRGPWFVRLTREEEERKKKMGRAAARLKKR